MWQSLDKLWQTSPTFKVLAPIAMIGVVLVMGNFLSSFEPPEEENKGPFGVGSGATEKVGRAIGSAADAATTAANAVTGSIVENTEYK